MNTLLSYSQDEVISFLRDQLHDIKDCIRDSKIGGKPVNQKYAEYYLSYYQDKLEFVREAPELFNKNETPVTQECDSAEGSNSPHIEQNELAIYLKYTNVIVTPNSAKAIAAEFGVHISCSPQSFYAPFIGQILPKPVYF